MMSVYDDRLSRFKKSVIYPVVTSEFCAGRSSGEVLDSLLSAGARVVQLREKSLSDRDYLALARTYRERTSRTGCLLIIDDRPDIALAVGADGVHLGSDDLPIREVRRFAPDLLVGASTHSPDEIREAQTTGASYLNIGPVFPTRTKSLPIPALGLDSLRRWIPLVTIPFSVMGGITLENIASVRDAGAVRFAMVTALTAARDISADYRSIMAIVG